MTCKATCTFCFLASCFHPLRGEWNRMDLPGANTDNALCTDGSVPVLYTQLANPEEWLVYFDQGGCCAPQGLDDTNDILAYCLEQRQLWPTYYSSKFVDNSLEGINTFSEDELNPFLNFSKVWISYCSQDLWIGNRGFVLPDGQVMNFYGGRIVRRLMTWLNSTYFSPRTSLVVQGSSAGSIGLINHMSWIKSSIQHSSMKAILDSGWMMSFGTFMSATNISTFTDEAGCAIDWAGAPCCAQLDCAALTLDFPPKGVQVFIIQHIYDPEFFSGYLPDGALNQAVSLLRYGEQTRKAFKTITSFWRFVGKNVTLFTSDCVMHSGFVAAVSSLNMQRLRDYLSTNSANVPSGIDVFTDLWIKLEVQGVNLRTALTSWLEAPSTGVQLYERSPDLTIQEGWCPVVLSDSFRLHEDLWQRMQIFGWVVVLFMWFLSIVGICVAASDHARIKHVARSADEYTHAMAAHTYTQVRSRRSSSHKNPFIFNSISFELRSGKKVLINASGRAQPGRLLAIMGRSGCGKTTLLEVLSMRRVSRGQLTGSIKSNGALLATQDDLFNFLVSTGYVTQYGKPQFSNFSVIGCLYFAAEVQLYRKSRKSKDEQIYSLLHAFGLSNCVNVPVKRLSGGQLRRLMVVIELLSSPSILFLDEPTSGLDAASALEEMSFLHSFARHTGTIIIMSIHQPSLECFELLDDLLLMREGHSIFCGHREDAVRIARELLCSHEGSPNDSIADNILDVLPSWSAPTASDAPARAQFASYRGRFNRSFTGIEVYGRPVIPFRIRLRCSTSGYWLELRRFDYTFAFAIVPLLPMFIFGFSNVNRNHSLELPAEVILLLSIPSSMLVMILCQQSYPKRMLPIVYQMRSLRATGQDFVISWLLTDLFLMTVSMPLAVLSTSAIGFRDLLQPIDYSSLALISIFYVSVLGCLTMFLIVLVHHLHCGPADIVPSAIFLLVTAFAGVFNGITIRLGDVPSVYRLLGYLSPGLWFHVPFLTVLLNGKTIQGCLSKWVSSVPQFEGEVCKGNRLLSLLGSQDYDFLPAGCIAYGFGCSVVFTAIAAATFRVAFLYRVRMLRMTRVDSSGVFTPSNAGSNPVSEIKALDDIEDINDNDEMALSETSPMSI